MSARGDRVPSAAWTLGLLGILLLVFSACKHDELNRETIGGPEAPSLDPRDYSDCPDNLFGEGTLGLLVTDAGIRACRGRAPSTVGDFPPHPSPNARRRP